MFSELISWIDHLPLNPVPVPASGGTQGKIVFHSVTGELDICPSRLPDVGNRNVTSALGVRKERQTAVLMGHQRGCRAESNLPSSVCWGKGEWLCLPWRSEGPGWERACVGWLDSGQLANGLLQQEAGSGHQIFWGLWKKFSHAPSQCNKSKIKKIQIQFLLPTLIIESLIYLHYKVTVSRAFSGLLIFPHLSFQLLAFCILAANPENYLCGGLTILFQGHASWFYIPFYWTHHRE